MRGRIFAAAAAVGFAAISLASPASATPAADDGVHKVWVCKFVTAPGVDEILKGGKQPIAVDFAANEAPIVGALFKDGQFMSVVLDYVTDENTAHPGNYYTGSLRCPTETGGS